MMYFLLMDFGTTSLKTAVVDLDTGLFSHIKSHPALPNCGTDPGRYEVSPGACRTDSKPCATSTSNELGVPVRGHRGVQRAERRAGPGRARPAGDELHQLERRALAGADRRREHVRPGHGAAGRRLQAHHRLAAGAEPAHDERGPPGPAWASCRRGSGWSRCRSGWTCAAATRPTSVHDTMLHCLGFYDVRQRETSARPDRLRGRPDRRPRCAFNPTAPTGTVSGYWHHQGRQDPGLRRRRATTSAPCWERATSPTGPSRSTSAPARRWRSSTASPHGEQIGAAAVLRRAAAADRSRASRRAAPWPTSSASWRRSPGRAAGKADFWRMLSELDEADLTRRRCGFDLAVFSSAWNYRGGGRDRRTSPTGP